MPRRSRTPAPAPGRTVRLVAPEFVGARVRLISGLTVTIGADRIVAMDEDDARLMVEGAGWRLADEAGLVQTKGGDRRSKAQSAP